MKQDLTTILNSMKYMSKELMSDKKVSAVAPMYTFRKQYEAAQRCKTLISKTRRLAGK